MPLLTAGALRQLASSCLDAAVPQTGPLPGAYHRRALPVARAAAPSPGELALAAALDELDTATIELDPALLVNVNSQEELAGLT